MISEKINMRTILAHNENVAKSHKHLYIVYQNLKVKMTVTWDNEIEK